MELEQDVWAADRETNKKILVNIGKYWTILEESILALRLYLKMDKLLVLHSRYLTPTF